MSFLTFHMSRLWLSRSCLILLTLSGVAASLLCFRSFFSQGTFYGGVLIKTNNFAYSNHLWVCAKDGRGGLVLLAVSQSHTGRNGPFARVGTQLSIFNIGFTPGMSKWEDAATSYPKMPPWPLLSAFRHEGFGFGFSFGTEKSWVNGEPEQKRDVAMVLPLPVVVLLAFIFPVRSIRRSLRRKRTGFPVSFDKTCADARRA